MGKGLLLAGLIACLAAAAPAPAAVPVGAMAPGIDISTGENPTNCLPPATSRFQGTVGGSTPYSWIVPFQGVVVSWGTVAGNAPGPEPAKARFRVYRATASATGFRVVGDSGQMTLTTPPDDVTPGIFNQFLANIPVAAGDRIGIRHGDSSSSGGPCHWGGLAGDSFRFALNGPLVLPPDTETFSTGAVPNFRVNVRAMVEPDADGDGFADETRDACVGAGGPEGGCPDNDFTLGKLTRKRNGTATLAVIVPGKGSVTAAQSGFTAAGAAARRPLVRQASTQVGAGGTIKLKLRPTRKGRSRLNRRGRLRALIVVTFEPTGFTAKSQTRRVKLIKR